MKSKRTRAAFHYLVLASVLSFGLAGIALAQTGGTFSETGSMNVARYKHTATLLNDGRVLITGGVTNDSAYSTSSAELYDPATGIFSFTGSMSTGRAYHTATMLDSGKVLIVGGSAYCDPYPNGGLATAELYDPATGTFALTGSMGTDRSEPAAAILPNGNVLIISNYTSEIYDAASGTFAPTTGQMTTARYVGTLLTPLMTGKVLVTGGAWAADGTAEIYDPITDTFSDEGFLCVPRQSDMATLLDDGRVLIAGGWYGPPGAEVYDPVTGVFTPSYLSAYPRYLSKAELLGNGQVLIPGGVNAGWVAESLADIWDPVTGDITSTGSLMTARAWHTVTTLNNGRILVVGGFSGYLGEPYSHSSAEIYTPSFIPIAIDIKPGSYPNTFNQNEHGVIPVAILSDSDLDVRDINVESLLLQGLSVKMAGKSGKYLAHYEDIDNDGDEDLVVQFQDSDSWVVPGNDYAVLSGSLSNGIQIQGADTISIVP